MSKDGDGSVTEWMGHLKTGSGDDASRHLWDRFFPRLARLAETHLRTSGCVSADGEDVALIAFESFFRGFAAGRFANLSNRDDLWRLLVTITARKARNLQRAERTQKRGGGRATGEAARARTDRESNDFLAQIVGDQPTPEFAAMASDRCRELFGSLHDESLRVVALLKLEGYSNEEIARSLDCGLRTVERKLDVIRKRWTTDDAP